MRIMAAYKLFSLLILVLTSTTFAADFPISPDPYMTPGSVCKRPDTYRYPERIPYCERDVETQTKREIIRKYDVQLGYHIQSMNRDHFKIDHLIPLCAGGSNEVSNLWPQHRSIYKLTDPIEPLLCEKMAEGKLKQRDAIELIMEAKTYPKERAREVYFYLQRL